MVLNWCDFESSPHQRQSITRLRGYEETLEDDVFAAFLPLLLSAPFSGPCPCRCPCPCSRDVYALSPISRNPFTRSETEDVCTMCGLIVIGYNARYGLLSARSETKIEHHNLSDSFMLVDDAASRKFWRFCYYFWHRCVRDRFSMIRIMQSSETIVAACIKRSV